ncbi:MAG: DUF1835 domain-containing protein [Chitinophaga sp.]|uniref:DUF3658 domain-containing protein n=1 Tax=Chitinophaga sp. TaxID=1869181 RepID=UPI001B084B72|nr:DUF3658 domain-containing protein [Chitinophaga sp.]MBO9732464.1 DUF1835 domain-containing protein [Chitinophaga sp.]
MKDLHITSSISVAGTLRLAIYEHLLAGDAIGFNELPGIGPLDDGGKRTRYLQSLVFGSHPGYQYAYLNNVFDSWHQLQQRLHAHPVDRLIIWAGSDGNDYVFTRMACWWLREIPVDLWLVNAPTHGGNDIASYNQQELASLFTQAGQITAHTLNELAREYENIAARPELLRECDENGQLQFLDEAIYDDTILGYNNDKRWISAVRIIGQIIGFSDRRNPINEVFASGRIKALVAAGKLKARGDMSSMRTFELKRAKE